MENATTTTNVALEAASAQRNISNNYVKLKELTDKQTKTKCEKVARAAIHANRYKYVSIKVLATATPEQCTIGIHVQFTKQQDDIACCSSPTLVHSNVSKIAIYSTWLLKLQ